MNRDLAFEIVIDSLELRASMLVTKMYHMKESKELHDVEVEIERIEDKIKFLREEMM